MRPHCLISLVDPRRILVPTLRPQPDLMLSPSIARVRMSSTLVVYKVGLSVLRSPSGDSLNFLAHSSINALDA